MTLRQHNKSRNGTLISHHLNLKLKLMHGCRFRLHPGCLFQWSRLQTQLPRGLASREQKRRGRSVTKQRSGQLNQAVSPLESPNHQQQMVHWEIRRPRSELVTFYCSETSIDLFSEHVLVTDTHMNLLNPIPALSPSQLFTPKLTLKRNALVRNSVEMNLLVIFFWLWTPGSR